MKNKMKYFISLTTIGVFLLFAPGCLLGPDKIEYGNVPISDCQSRPPVTVGLNINGLFVDSDGNPIKNNPCEIFIRHQKVKPDTTCTFDVDQPGIVSVTTNSSGHLIYSYSNTWVHDNSEDLINVEVKLFGTAEHESFREWNTLKYDKSTWNFYTKVLKKNIL